MPGMSTKVSLLTLCAILLATFMGSAAARSVGGKSAYAALANHLHQATSSDKLVDNIQRIGLLEIQQPNASKELKQLGQLFGSLKHDSADAASMCSKDNLSSLRQLTETMSRDGNLGPKEITEPIRRLNGIIIRFIDEAYTVCGRHLAAEWPLTEESFDNNSKVAKCMKKTVYGLNDNSFDHIELMGETISAVLGTESVKDSVIPLGSGAKKVNSATMDVKLLARQVEKYIYGPCKEFLELDESKLVLEPYNELNESWLIIKDGMEKFYKDGFQKPYIQWGKRRQPIVDQAAERYRTCARLLTMSVPRIALSVARARLLESGQSVLDKTKLKASILYDKIKGPSKEIVL